jgi:hypothetical protein
MHERVVILGIAVAALVVASMFLGCVEEEEAPAASFGPPLTATLLTDKEGDD